MRPFVFSIAVFIFTLTACGSPDRKTPDGKRSPLTGKWHRFSMENGYSEFDIDSQYVIFYNQKVGRFRLPYKIENDSLKYLSSQYAAKITDYGDSILLEGNDSTTAILHRFNESDIPFYKIPEDKDSVLFASYLKGFDRRLIMEFEKAGISISDNRKDENPSYEELLKKRNN